MTHDGARVGLSLSGGGFRATLFHIGSLWRLNELGWLNKLDRICSVSGGSITAGVLGRRWKELEFDPASGVATNFNDLVAAPLRDFCARTTDVGVILKGFLSPFHRTGDFLAGAYDKALFHGTGLDGLPGQGEGPNFIILGTNYQTGVSYRFSRRHLSDYRLGELPEPKLKLATAVAVSSAFPPFLAPILLRRDPEKWKRTKWSDPEIFNNADYRRLQYLADGGVYDNLGLEPIWKRYDVVLCSDAGAPLPDISKSWWLRHSSVSQMKRVLGIAIDQQRALRKRWLIDDFIDGRREGTYWGITTHIDDYGLPDPMLRDNKLTESLHSMRTRLDAFSQAEQGHLINWGYALTDAAMRRHVIGEGEPAPPPSWPAPDFPLSD